VRKGPPPFTRGEWGGTGHGEEKVLPATGKRKFSKGIKKKSLFSSLWPAEKKGKDEREQQQSLSRKIKEINLAGEGKPSKATITFLRNGGGK